MYMCFYNSGEIGKPPLYGTRRKASSKTTQVQWHRLTGFRCPRNLQLPEAVGGRTLSAPLTKSQHKGNSHRKATWIWWHRTHFQDAMKKGPDVYSTVNLKDHPESIICGNISL